MVSPGLAGTVTTPSISFEGPIWTPPARTAATFSPGNWKKPGIRRVKGTVTGSEVPLPLLTVTWTSPSAIVSEAVSGQDHVHGTKPEGSTRATKTGCDMAGMAGHKTAKKGDHAMGCGMGGTAKKMACCN